MKLAIKFNILFFIFILFLCFSFKNSSNEINPIKERQAAMLLIQKTSKQIYKEININKNTLNLKNKIEIILSNTKIFSKFITKEFKGGEAGSEIWNEPEIFKNYQNQFLFDINKLKEKINSNNIENIQDSFNVMISNCGKCHRKFKN